MSVTGDSTLANPDQRIADLERELAECKAERDENQAEKEAMAEVLGVINASPGDLAPVFDAMLEKALHLCSSSFGFMADYDGEYVRVVAERGIPAELAEFHREPYRVVAGTPMYRFLQGEEVFHVVDAISDPSKVSPRGQAYVDLGGARSFLAVPMRKDGGLLGCFLVFRQHVEAFSPKQIALLQNFAAQAVIAMENARLITETREALEQQTATAEVLQVINSSPGELTPVFDAILERAHVLCGAASGGLMLIEDNRYRAVAVHGDKALAEYWLDLGWIEFPTGDDTLFGRLSRGELVHYRDAAVDDGTPKSEQYHRLVELAGARSLVLVPLRKDDALFGAITAFRKEPQPFSDKQIALLQNFAAQAVIAMENARLITETREALEQQTATAEVLGVINSSPGDLVPVFDAMLEKTLRLCEAVHGNFLTYDGEVFHQAAFRGEPQLAEYRRPHGPLRPAEFGQLARVARGGGTLHRIDAREDEAYRDDPAYRQMVDGQGIRTSLTVPLRKGDALLGLVRAYRREVRPFTDKQIALVESFAAQAVIAMENARLLTETREALEQQTATAEVLQVINSSPGDLAPVFDAILEKAHTLCGIAHGDLMIYDGEHFRGVAFRGTPEPFADLLRQPLRPSENHERLLLGERLIHTPDVAAVAPTGPIHRAAIDAGVRTLLLIPLRKDDALLGYISAHRRDVRPFSEREIALLENFAAQAVIAMENARLLTETRESLEQQTATAEVLQVINASPGDLVPVFDAILEKAHSLCAVTNGILAVYDGEHASAVAMRGVWEPLAGLLRQPFRPLPNSPHARLVRGERVIHIPDLAVETLWERDDPKRVASAEHGVRTMLFVPLRKDDTLLGWISANRLEVRPFSEKEIGLLENFAAQAVIAMDNARLLDEIRQRQAELRVTFDNMGDGVAMFDAELRLAAWNLNFQRLLDLPNTLLVQRPAYVDYIRILAERGEFGSGDIEEEMKLRIEATDQELRLERTRPDGRVIEVRRNAVPGGGFVLIIGDITERKRAEAEIRAARDTAEKALQELQAAQASLLHAQKMAALGQLTAGIAHEIKNPLNFVNNFAELSGELLLELKETTAPAVAALGGDERAAVDEVVELLRGNLDKIAEHGKRADGIVKSMLEHSRGVSGERRVVDLNTLIEEALNLAYHGARAQDASFNITLEREFDRGLAPTELAPQEMTRVFLNLFGNGFYATAKRQRDGAGLDFRPTLKVATRDFGDAVEVRVRDNGTGIAPEIRDRLFQPFATTKPTGEGTGLGLSIAYDIIVQQHGGAIEVDSRVNEFTEFAIRLPRTLLTTAQAAS
jgi:GAF domain-containing protein